MGLGLCLVLLVWIRDQGCIGREVLRRLNRLGLVFLSSTTTSRLLMLYNKFQMCTCKFICKTKPNRKTHHSTTFLEPRLCSGTISQTYLAHYYETSRIHMLRHSSNEHA